MDTHLVGAARVEGGLDQRCLERFPVAAHHRVRRTRRTTPSGDRHPGGLARRAADRRVHHAGVGFDEPGHEGPVVAAGGVLAELPTE